MRGLLAFFSGPCLALLLLGCTPAQEPEPILQAPSHLLLLTVDTLRADHLSSYGYGRLTSPNLDRLARDGVRFDQVAVQWPKTGPSFASIFTSTYSKDNDIVRQVGIPLPCRFQMLAEVLQEQGYSTHAVVANGALAREFSFDQGFDTYIETWKLPADESSDPNGAEAVTRLALGVLDQIDPTRPFFLWVHYLDPHFPYQSPGSWQDRFQGDELYDPDTKIHIFKEKSRNQMYGIGRDQVLDGQDELAFYTARYDAEIAYTDHQIGRLLEVMEGRGLLEKTLTVLTSDHGESLAEHFYHFDHGRFAFQTCLRVPLIFHYPGVLTPRVDNDPVELVHLAPTLLEAAGVGLEKGTWMQGRSLARRLVGEGEAGEESRRSGLAFSEAGWETGGRWQKSVRDRRFKLILAESPAEQRWIGGSGVRFILYDLDADPGETKNVAGDFPDTVERLKGALWRWDRAEPFPLFRDPPGCDDASEVDDRTEKLLRSLGYLGGGDSG